MHVMSLVKVNLSDNPEHSQIFYLGDILIEFERTLATSILIMYQKIFAFNYEDISGLDPNLIVHNIVTYPDTKLIKKLCKFYPTQSLLIKDKIQNILKAKFIEFIDYTKWVSNMVPVNHINGYLWIYMNFFDLNKAYPKDNFSLPNIDIWVDNTMGYEMLSLMDGLFNYNQI